MPCRIESFITSKLERGQGGGECEGRKMVRGLVRQPGDLMTYDGFEVMRRTMPPEIGTGMYTLQVTRWRSNTSGASSRTVEDK